MKLMPKLLKAFNIDIKRSKNVVVCDAQKHLGRPSTSDENIECVQQSFTLSPYKSTRRAGLDLDLIHSTV